MSRTTTRPLNPGILYGVAAYGIWGVLPVYLKLLHPLPAPDILAHRILWSLLLLAGLAIALKHGPALASIVRRPRVLLALTASALLIGVNWLFYILAVNGGHVADASLGYFINPLGQCGAGRRGAARAARPNRAGRGPDRRRPGSYG